MAKENFVMLEGIALSDTKLKCDRDGTPNRAMLFLRVVDRKQINILAGAEDVRYATIFIYSGNEGIIGKMQNICEGDLVEIVGTITTASVNKRRRCPSCSTVIASKSGVTYISPIFASQHEHGLSDEAANRLLLERVEVSNRVNVIGNLCNDPGYDDGNGQTIPKLEYQIALPRTIRVDDDTADEDTDYPWVMACGQQAEEGRDALGKGSIVYIKGHLRSKETQKTIQCPACGTTFMGSDFPTIFITPHFTEYLKNCNFPDAQSEE